MPQKSQTEKLIEKQIKEQQKQAREQRILAKAQALVDGARFVDGFRIMDDDSEMLFKLVMDAYDGNGQDIVVLCETDIPHTLQMSLNVRFKALQLYGVISDDAMFMGMNIRIQISEAGKRYFERKDAAETNHENLAIMNAGNRSVLSQHKKYDVFISHAAKDKSDYVEGLYMKLRRLGIQIFYDTDSISWGDKWKERILDGIEESEFAIIVISQNFFGREWTERELNELLTRQNDFGQKIVLPLLHGITVDELKSQYPEVGEIQCINTDDCNKEEVTILLAKELIKRYR